MGRVYKATGINLKSMPLGESDRLLSILTHEYGLIRAVAVGARKPRSKLGGRSSLFVVNELLLIQGRSLDKVSQAETITSFAGLSQNLAKLTASQYLAELALYQALSNQSQADLMTLLCQQLTQLEQARDNEVLPYLTWGILQLLEIAGVLPHVQSCCLTQQPLVPTEIDPSWQVGFSPSAGGTILLSAQPQKLGLIRRSPPDQFRTAEISQTRYQTRPRNGEQSPQILRLNAVELDLLQTLAQSLLGKSVDASTPFLSFVPLPPRVPEYSLSVWMAIERVLRHYAQYYFDRSIRSAALIETCFVPASPLSATFTAV